MADPTGRDITGTLGPGSEVAGLIQALLQQQQQQVGQQAQQTAQAQQQAGQSYQEAAGAPVDFGNPLAQLLPALIGNVGAVLTQHPELSKRGQEVTQLNREQILQKRKDNLALLLSDYEQKSKAAQQAGDAETALKSRQNIDRVTKTLEGLTKHSPTRATADILANMSEDEYGRYLKRKRELADAGRPLPRPRPPKEPKAPKPRTSGKVQSAAEAAALIEMAKTSDDLKRAAKILNGNPLWAQDTQVRTAIEDAKKRLGGGK